MSIYVTTRYFKTTLIIIRPLNWTPKCGLLGLAKFYFKTTCYVRPHFQGSAGGLKTQGALFCCRYFISLPFLLRQISLVSARHSSMAHSVRAHQSAVSMLETLSPLDTGDQPILARETRLLSCGSDLKINIWEVAQIGFESEITLNLLQTVRDYSVKR